jgi:DNA-binding CsgD family transcriptional regulator
MSNREAAESLFVTKKAIEFHLGNVYRKLGVPNRLAAATIAHSHGLGEELAPAA